MSAPSVRTTVKRNAMRAVYDRERLLDVLNAQQVCFVAYVVDGEPRQIPTLYFCDEHYIYLHGNRQSALLKYMQAGGEVSILVTLVDGTVVARSGFHCSMNYRSVSIFGKGEEVTGEAHAAALDGFVRALVPGHEQAVRAPTPQELAATTVVRVSLDEMSAKIRDGGPIDDAGDVDSDVWAGVIPVAMTPGTPIPADDLPAGVAMPDYIETFKYRG